MIINENTKVIARLHTKASPRGLNIYNPYFEEMGINALYVLFYNPDPAVLITGLRSLNLAGAITAGFESNETLPSLLDSQSDVSKYVGKVGFIKNENGKLIGDNQGGEGLLRSIQNVGSLEGKKVVIIGGGNIAKGLLFNIKKSNIKTASLTILNRSADKLTTLKNDFSFISTVGPLSDLTSTAGDVLINATDIGGSEEDTLFSRDIVAQFSQVADVTFEKEETNLINIARKMDKKVSTGWDMFVSQGQVILESILGIDVDPVILKKHVVTGLSSVVS